MPVSAQDKLGRQQKIDKARNRRKAAREKAEETKRLRALCSTMTREEYQQFCANHRRRTVQNISCDVVDALTEDEPLDLCRFLPSKTLASWLSRRLRWKVPPGIEI